MRYRIENYIAMKLHSNLEELETVIDGYGVVEFDDIEYSNGFLVWNTEKEVVEHKYFNPALYEKWNGVEIVEDTEKRLQDEKFAEERRKDLEFKLDGRKRVEVAEDDIVLTQEAVNFLIFGTMDTRAAVYNTTENTNGGTTMALYLASQIMKKAKLSLEAGRNFYDMSIVRYPDMQGDIDFILRAEGWDSIIDR